MRLFGLLCLSIAIIGSSGCADQLRSQQPPAKPATGFWFWHGSSADVSPTSEPLDVLFVHAGTLRKEPYGERWWVVNGELPDRLPSAREYWLVFRYERQQVPDIQAAPIVAGEVFRLQQEARARHLHVAGVQLDIDSPTGALAQYAYFLRELRKAAPGVEISITALLDWFQDGTAIADVIKQTDEFVPQFYDAAALDGDVREASIAAKFDGARWGPIFDRFGKRFRIGISSFGRARFVPRENAASRGSHARLYRDIEPLDIAANPAFALRASRNEASELVLSYTAVRKNRIDYSEFGPGDTIQFIVSTPETIRAAVDSAKRMPKHFAGFVFFRWPASNESWMLQPAEVLIAAGTGPLRKKSSRIDVIDGGCVAVKCADLFLVSVNALSAMPSRYRIHSSTQLEYFLPEEKTRVRMTDASGLELALPPYCGTARMYLGRAVTMAKSDFTVEEAP